MGAFTAIILEDEQPIFDFRQTSNGPKKVNINVFDLKIQFRKLVGGSKIHCSNDEWETNKDLTILFGLNSKDFFEKNPGYEKEIHSLHEDCCGTRGFDSIKQLFYLLNNTTKYCVLRNFECLPDNYTIKGHGDIDLLVEHRQYVEYLTRSERAFAEEYRVYNYVTISGKKIPFDFRYVNDNYYDVKWEIDILKTRILNKDCFFTPNSSNTFYTLLYHAYIQKPNISPDYTLKLGKYAREINESYEKNTDIAVDKLDSFLLKNNYKYTRANDFTVFFNTKNLEHSKIYTLDTTLVKSHFFESTDQFSKTYKTSDSFLKEGSPEIINNEYRHLQSLDKYPFFPKILNKTSDSIKISQLLGKNLKELSEKRLFLSTRQQISILLELSKILEVLYTEQIIHRDFTPENILVNVDKKICTVSLIDFGWAIKYGEESSASNPTGLGCIYRHPVYFSDSYALSQVIKEFLRNNSLSQKIGAILEQISSNEHPTPKDVKPLYGFLLNINRTQLFIFQLSNLCKIAKTSRPLQAIQKKWKAFIFHLHFRKWLSMAIRLTNAKE